MRVRLDYLGGKRFKVYSRQHSFYVDFPAAKGGSDSAPNPIDYFIGALGSCMALSGLKHCQDVGIPCENVRFTLNAELEEDSSHVKKIDCTISSLSVPVKDKKAALVDAMKKCIISQTIESKPEITINIEEPPEETISADDQSESEEGEEPKDSKQEDIAKDSRDKASSDSETASSDIGEQDSSADNSSAQD